MFVLNILSKKSLYGRSKNASYLVGKKVSLMNPYGIFLLALYTVAQGIYSPSLAVLSINNKTIEEYCAQSEGGLDLKYHPHPSRFNVILREKTSNLELGEIGLDQETALLNNNDIVSVASRIHVDEVYSMKDQQALQIQNQMIEAPQVCLGAPKIVLDNVHFKTSSVEIKLPPITDDPRSHIIFQARPNTVMMMKGFFDFTTGAKKTIHLFVSNVEYVGFKLKDDFKETLPASQKKSSFQPTES